MFNFSQSAQTKKFFERVFQGLPPVNILVNRKTTVENTVVEIRGKRSSDERRASVGEIVWRVRRGTQSEMSYSSRDLRIAL